MGGLWKVMKVLWGFLIFFCYLNCDPARTQDDHLLIFGLNSFLPNPFPGQ
jgi:hypothetical protein